MMQDKPCTTKADNMTPCTLDKYQEDRPGALRLLASTDPWIAHAKSNLCIFKNNNRCFLAVVFVSNHDLSEDMELLLQCAMIGIAMMTRSSYYY